MVVSDPDGAGSCRSSVDQLVAGLPRECGARVVGDGHVVPLDLTHDSRAVSPATAFACVRGSRHDGHDYAHGAVAAGATVLIVDHELPAAQVTGPDGRHATQLVVADVRQCLGHIAAAMCGHPSRDLLTVGVTGTNGKTTTVALLAAIFDAAGHPAGVIGTLSGAHTTPEAPELQRRLAGFRDAGKAAAVMEVSSHALELHRVTGTRFAAGVFTNLGEDHLDLHGSREAYFRAKAKLFTPELAQLAVVNADDPHGQLLIDAAGIDVVSFSAGDAADIVVSASAIEMTRRSQRLRVPIGGHFNVTNVLAAAATAAALGLDDATIADGLATVQPVRGRFERVSATSGSDDIDVVVDYGHTPDALDSVLDSARQLIDTGSSVVVVFGCGGDRDRQKRPRMGAVAARRSDVMVVTSDNPRSEPPGEIIDAIVSGVNSRDREHVVVEPDRRTAIFEAIGRATPGDIVVIAGKGHESTQIVGETAMPFDDREVAVEALAARAGDRS